MSLIYEPSGKAREYSPLALNIYTGCDHACKYCYVSLIKYGADNSLVKIRANFLKLLEKELIKSTPKAQILLSFMCDPYSHFDIDCQETRKALVLLQKYGALAAVLTKGGSRCLRDVDIFKQFGNRIKIGATLTFVNDQQSLEIEPKAAPPQDRLDTLKTLHDQGVKTFVSIEPVIDPAQSLELISASIDFVDQYKIGKMNHFEKRFSPNIDWKDFLYSAVGMLRYRNKSFYIKDDLRAFDTDKILTQKESDYNELFLKPEMQDMPCAEIAEPSLF